MIRSSTHASRATKFAASPRSISAQHAVKAPGANVDDWRFAAVGEVFTGRGRV